MSLRRPKMQIKPKVWTRATTAKAANDAVSKKKPEVAAKTIENVIADNVVFIEEADKTSDAVDSSSTAPLTTSFVEIVDHENTELIQEVKEKVSNDKTKVENPVVIPNTDRDKPSETVNPTIESNEPKTEKVSKTKAKTNRKRKTGQTSDKSVMRMKDLLLYNPPMTDDQKEMKEKNSEQDDRHLLESNENVSSKEDNEENCQDKNIGPRVKVGADGQLILDEESVIVKRKKSIAVDGPALLESASTTSACTNYSSFRCKNKSVSKHRWTEAETIRFYSALNTIGTDFTLMADLFFRGKRSRVDLRNKFKKEEKTNKMMIDEALFSPNTFINQCPELDELLDDSSDSDDDNQQKNKKQKSVKSKA